jgi:hypothetical protein
VATSRVLRQVTLRRASPSGGFYFLVVWIDEPLARVHKLVRDDDGIIWTVAETWGPKLFEEVDKQHAVWKRWAEVLGG